MLQMNLLRRKSTCCNKCVCPRPCRVQSRETRNRGERWQLRVWLHRLRGAEALKLSLLKHDMDQLQHDVDEIDGFASTLKADSLSGVGKGGDVINNSAIPVSTRSRYLEMCAEAE